MSIDPSDMNDGADPGVSQLLARGAADDVRAERRAQAAIDAYFADPEMRLDEQTRVALDRTIADIIAGIESELRQYAARLLAGRDQPALALWLSRNQPMVYTALRDAGILQQSALLRELLARVRQDLLAAALPPVPPQRPDQQSLVVRLAGHADRLVASAASALMAAEAHRRATRDGNGPARSDLPAEIHHQLVWWAAAALRDGHGSDAQIVLDRALTEAAQRSLSAHDEGDRLEAAAMRLVAGLTPQPGELQSLAIEALGDRRLALFIALLAQSVGFSYELMRDVVLDPVADRLWLVLRAAAFDREGVAAIGLALCEADPCRDVDQFADLLDGIMAVTPEQARAALARFALHPDFRAAVLALAKARRP